MGSVRPPSADTTLSRLSKTFENNSGTVKLGVAGVTHPRSASPAAGSRREAAADSSHSSAADWDNPLFFQPCLNKGASSATSISRPDGSPGPPSHQHADDTTLHVRTRQDLHAAIESSVLPFCWASGLSLNAGKSVAILLGETAEDQQGMDSRTGASFVERYKSVRHLGIRLSTDPLPAAEETYAGILGSVRQLTQIGRVYVAKEVQASKVT